MRPRSPTSSRCARLCRARPAASSGSPSARGGPGWPGGLAAWLGFTLPSAIALTALGLLTASADLADAGWVHGLKLAAVAVVAQAVWGMAGALTPDWPRRAVALAAAAVALAWTTPFSQVAIIAGGAVIGRLAAGSAARARPRPGTESGVAPGRDRRARGVRGAAARACRCCGDRAASPSPCSTASTASGALVFGGGHVVLPLLHTTVVDPGWVSDDQLPGRLRRGAGGARAAVHVRGISRRRVDPDARTASRGDHRARRDLPAGRCSWSWRRCRSGTRCGRRSASGGR